MRLKKVNNLRKIVIDNYEKIADEFDKTRKKYLWPELIKISNKVFNGANVLDAGCGNGRLLEGFKNKKINYFGFDNSLNLLNLAKKNYPKNKFKQIDLFNVEEINNNKYDYIFLVAVILHIPGKENRLKVIIDLAKKLKKGGTMVISAWDILSQKKFKKIIIKNTIKNFLSLNKFEKNDLLFPWKNNNGKELSLRYYHAFTIKELNELANSSGLEKLDIYKADNNFWLILKK